MKGGPVRGAAGSNPRTRGKLDRGFLAAEHTASALLDFHLHASPCAGDVGPEYEERYLRGIGMPESVTPRHSISNFTHGFGEGGYYASTFYSYLWSEMLSTGIFDEFNERGSTFDSDLSDRLYRYVFSTGNSVDPNRSFEAAYGRAPSVGPLLRKRGLDRSK
jgi:peptidyl-dipeptidase Dcp